MASQRLLLAQTSYALWVHALSRFVARLSGWYAGGHDRGFLHEADRIILSSHCSCGLICALATLCSLALRECMLHTGWEASFLCPVSSGVPLPGWWGSEGKDVLGWSSGRQAEGREEMETVWPADTEVRELSLPFLATWANLLSKNSFKDLELPPYAHLIL